MISFSVDSCEKFLAGATNGHKAKRVFALIEGLKMSGTRLHPR
jgi:hypothetical protein